MLASIFCPLTAVIVILSLLFAMSKLDKKAPLPPGPRRLPLIGNVFLLRELAKAPWLKFTEWHHKYGPVVYLDIAGQPMIILNTAEAAYDFLVCRGKNYSDRPRFVMAGEILAGGIHVGFVPFGSLWRKLRKAAHSGLNDRACEKYFRRQEESALKLVTHILSSPEKWDHHLQRSSTLNMFSIIYGMSDERDLEKNVSRINHFMARMLKAALPGNYLVDLFPVLNRLPSFMIRFKRDGMAAHAEFTSMFTSFISGENRSKAGNNLDSTFSTAVQTSQINTGLTKPEFSWLSGAMLGGGSDTTAAALAVFVLGMIHNPHIMRKAQNEIDAIVGRERVPQFSDQDKLPFVSAIIKETLRWRPITPLGLARRSLDADVYQNCAIPAGTLVVTNVWAMNHDSQIYEQPEKFLPERFLTVDGAVLDPPYTRGGTHAYGFGRRACPGLHLANNALFINIVTLLWAFDMTPLDSDKLPSLNRYIDTGVVVRPDAFPCKMIPRDGHVRHLGHSYVGC